MANSTAVQPHVGNVPLLKRWQITLNTCNCPEEVDIHQADFLTRWLVISRACVFSMTATSGFIGVLLALLLVRDVPGLNFNLLNVVLCIIGLVAAHATNNLVNDWTDVRKGVDTEDYPRAQYSVHPILGGLTTPENLLRASLLLTLLDGLIMLYLASVSGAAVIFFAVAGLALSLGYTAFLKRFALGELTALVVWGPLMIGGTVFAITGTITTEILLATLPYGLVVASVLVGKHIDKMEQDRAVKVHSLPVVMGLNSSLWLNKISFILFYVLVAVLILARITGPWILLTLLALPRFLTAWKIYSQPKPAEKPENWPVWPLWYVGWAMHFNRLAGVLFILGLMVNLLLPVSF